MNIRIGALVLAGTLLGAAALYPAVSEGRGGYGGSGNGGGRGQCGQTQSQCGQRLRDGSCGNVNCRMQSGQRLRDGSGPNPNCPLKQATPTPPPVTK